MNSSRLFNGPCQWCSQSVINRGETLNCKHLICHQCILSDKSCQSNCPYCWFIHAEQFVHVNRICPVCCSGLKNNNQPLPCSENHYHCSDCISQGCVLCQFRRSNSWNQNTYRDLPAKDQHILYTCHTWEMIFEQTNQQSSISKEIIRQDEIEYDREQPLTSGLKHSQTKRPNHHSNSEEFSDCMVCLEPLGSSYKKLSICGHCFHKSCIDQWFQSNGKQSCPTCGHLYGISQGPQPPNGVMTIKYIPISLSGFENERYLNSENPTIEITYSFSSGLQGSLNPNPGQPFSGTTRRAYLPNTKEGKDILDLLDRAFKDQHIFTIGRSTTTGQDNVITWNDIHHKTNIHGGPDRFGYPDPTYLHRVRQELADKGYK